jgi:hypothetical protein
MSIPALRSRATFGSGGAPRLFAQPRSCARRWTGNHSHRLVPQQMILIVRLAVSRALLSPPWREACSSDCTTRGIGNAAAIRIAGAGGRRWAARSNGGCRHGTSDSTTRVRPRRNGNGRTTRTRRSSSAIGRSRIRSARPLPGFPVTRAPVISLVGMLAGAVRVLVRDDRLGRQTPAGADALAWHLGDRHGLPASGARFCSGIPPVSHRVIIRTRRRT